LTASARNAPAKSLISQILWRLWKNPKSRNHFVQTRIDLNSRFGHLARASLDFPALGPSTFPNSGSANPTPTILALTYRAADALVDRYLKKPAPLA
jgi:hypothetical protein